MTENDPMCSEVETFDLLDQLHQILDCDPLIDELGFIHPSQLMMLNEGDSRLGSELSTTGEVERKNNIFWSREHKLGISTDYLLPLYKAAKHKFMDAYETYKKHFSLSLENDNMDSSCAFPEIEDEVMKNSKALLLLSSDFGTAWNARKLVISKREDFLISDELLLSALVLSLAPKSESSWNYRRWVIKRIARRCSTLEDIVEKESELVEKIAEKSTMNYRAWNHRSWLISYMTSEQALRELNVNKHWAALHVTDNSCFHYRRKLMLRILGDVSHGKVADTCITQFGSLKLIWKDEVDWNEVLIRRYIGREALWLHRRFLSVYWVKHFGTAQHGISPLPIEKGNKDNHVSVFIDNEVNLVQDCLNLPDSIFEDVQSQAIHSAAYLLWLNREILSSSTINLDQKLGADDLRTLLNKICPEKITVWDSLLREKTDAC
ncbi:Protein prenyltransferase alpha subunit repeat-containing protein 1 [Bienertia sinuspersici]